MMSASLRAGTYDAGASLLRTCSLPDLTSLVALDPLGSPGWDDRGQDSGESVLLEVEAASDSELHGKDGVFYDDVVAAASAEVGGGEGGPSEEEEEGSEEEWSSSGDEDLQQLVQTLQNFVEEASELLANRSPTRCEFGVVVCSQSLPSIPSIHLPYPDHLVRCRHL